MIMRGSQIGGGLLFLLIGWLLLGWFPLVGALMMALGAVSVVLALLAPAGPKSGDASASGVHGAARWATAEEAAPLYRDDGLILGVGGKGSLLRFAEQGNALVVGASRSKKGVSVVIPNLLTWPGSMVVTDPKGENYAVTARARRQLGQQAVSFSPLGPAPSWAFNPLDWVRPGEDMVDDVATIASAIVPLNPKDPGSHWEQTARILLRGFMAHAIAAEPPELRHLGTVHDYFSLGALQFESLLEKMAASSEGYGLPRKAANLLLGCGADERGSHLSTCRRMLAFLENPKLQRALSKSEFSMEALLEGRLSLYIGIPQERMEQYRGLLRLFAVLPMETVMRAKRRPRGGDLLLMLDEAAQFGYLEQVEAALSIAGGVGIKSVVVFQDKGQIKKSYPNEQLFLSTAVQVWLGGGIADLDTAKYVSERLGKKTVYQGNISTSQSQSTGFSKSNSSASMSESVSETGRSLLTPDEVLNLDAGRSIVFVRGVPPLQPKKAEYYSRPEFSGLHDENPYHSPDPDSVWADVAARARPVPAGVAP
jgi:type IV secretion system protein VirD4